MTFERKRLGQLGEDIAVKLLLKSGYKILERNFSTKVGEIDIVAQDGQDLVLVEVKTRFPGQFSLPEEAVTPFKIHHIARAGEYYQLLHPNKLDGPRIDVVAIEFGVDGKVKREEIIKSITS
jgi:putative endonuclease